MADIIPSAKYIQIVDTNGNTKWLARPSNKSLLGFDGDDAYWIDGTETYPIVLPDLEVKNGQMVGIAGFLASGRMFNFVGENDKRRFLVSEAGIVEWADLSLESLPDTGEGVLIKPPDGDAVYFSDPGLVWIDEDGNVSAIPDGTEGQQLVINGGEPKFRNATPGTVSSGISFTGLDGVLGKNTSAAVVNIQVPSFTLSDGVDEITVVNVNVSADVSASIGEGGIDAGAEDTNKWYYVYIISDGSTTDAIISLNPTTPDLSGTTGPFTHWALASVFRNDGAGNIVDFRQRGRRFSIAPQTYGNNISVTTSFAAVPGTVNLNTLVPPSVKSVSGSAGGSTTETATRNLMMATTSGGIGTQYVPAKQGGADLGNFSFDVGPFDLIIDDPSSPALYWKSSANSSRRRVEINGYRI